MDSLRAGRLNKVIVIQSRTETTDEWGGTVFAWAEYKTLRAKVRPLRGRELVAAQAAQSETEVMFYTRYFAGVDTSMRIAYNSKYYDITSIINVNERNRELEISTKTGLSEG